MPASKYFSIKEVSCHHCGEDKADPAFLKKLDALRLEWGEPLNVSCVYRCPVHNKAIGGAEHSRHLVGDAADILIGKYDPAKQYRLLKLIVELGFTVGVRSNIFHVDTRPGLPIVFTYSA